MLLMYFHAAAGRHIKGFHGMGEIQMVLPGLFIGSYQPATDKQMLDAQGITHICSCFNMEPLYPDDFKYKVLQADDMPGQVRP